MKKFGLQLPCIEESDALKQKYRQLCTSGDQLRPKSFGNDTLGGKLKYNHLLNTLKNCKNKEI